MAADHVARRLALDGLLATTAAAIKLLGSSRFLAPASEEEAQLESIGLPVDLLRHFQLGAGPGTLGALRSIAEAVAAWPDPAALKKQLSKIEFKFEPTCSGFVAASESGEMPATWLRVQLPGGEYWGGMGAGGGLDVLRQLVALLPEARFLVHVEERHLPGFAGAVREWKGVTPGRVMAVISDSAVSQWAQDNSKPGVSKGAQCLLLPRFASRAEDAPTFVPGDTFLADGLAAAGASVSQSPLLFQGGNVMMVTRPGTGERVLLVGEGEIERHVSLGLMREHAIEAYRIEFGADQCEVLPAVSFHIDYEVSVRAVGMELIALVPDERAGALIVLNCGLTAAARAGLIPPAVAEKAASAIRDSEPMPAVSALGQVLTSHAVRPGQISESIADVFSAGSADSGVGNLQRIMAAMDLMTAVMSSPSAMPADRHPRAYLQSLTRRLADRRLLHRQLVRIGMRIAPVPSIGEGRRALSAINGVHACDFYLMPAYGGLFSPMDESAAEAISAALGPGVAVRQVLCGETQRRAGAVHCAVSMLPDVHKSDDVRARGV